MSVNANKGQKISLKEEIESGKIKIGLGWEKRKVDGEAHDLDSSILLLESDGICKGPQDVCFYQEGYRVLHDNAVIHHGDEHDGSKIGDNEKIEVDLNALPARIKSIIIIASIHHAAQRNQNFGQVADAYIRLINPETMADIITFDLGEDASLSTAIEFARIDRENGDWIFTATALGTNKGLADIMQKYGLKTKNG